MKTNAQMGMIANIVVGIVGAGIGGWLAPMLGIAAEGIGTSIVSVLGAIFSLGFEGARDLQVGSPLQSAVGAMGRRLGSLSRSRR